jgi:tetratricopeptide (TPR) repeat protein
MIDRSFATETATMRTLPFSSSTHVDWSFRIGLSLVVLFAAAQIFGVGYYYLGQRYARTAAAPRTTTAAAAPAATVAPAKVARTVPSPSVAPSAAPTVAPAPSAAAVAAASPSTSTLSTADRLLKEATGLRERGDTTNALARLQDAVRSDPKNANVLAEMATIYESIKEYGRSNETWRKVEEIGPSAGSVYELAELKLKRGAVATPAPAAVEASPADAVTARAGAEGIPEGSTFGIAELTANETPDSDADTNLMLRIGVKKRANAVVDHTKVKIQVFFYDTVDDKDIKLTDAEVNYEWLTPNHDWAGPTPEVLAVTYVRAKNKAMTKEAELSAAAAAINPNRKTRPAKPASPDEAGQRKYLGYIVRVYYNDKLQAVRADPTKLLNLFPPPNTASSP